MAEDKAGCVLDENLSQLNPAGLTPLTTEVMHRQATINIGTIGHVAHGKSTLVKALSGVETTRFRKEKERSITIKLGYANAKIYKRVDVEGEGNGPGFFRAFGSSSFLDSRKRVIIPFSSSQPGGPGRVVAGPGSADELCNRGEWELVRHVSFVDCPGHDILMATMLNGAAVMDAATLLVAANEPCPQPQTAEHLAAIEIMQLENVLILQNKVDLVLPAVAHAHFDDIKSFTQGTVAEHAPVIPVSGALQYNVDVVAEYLCCIPVPVRDFTSDPRMMIIRSFDVNKPGQEVADLRGGVAGGSILQGVLRGGQEVEVRPGLVHKAKDGELSCRPLVTRVTSLQAESNALAYAVPGGLIGVGTTLDPTLSRADQLVGHVLGARDRLPPVLSRLEISYYLLRRLLGVKSHGEEPSVAPLGKGEVLMVNVGSTSSGGRVRSLKADLAKIELTTPVCCEAGGKVALSRRVSSSWRLIGWGKIVRGHALHVQDSE